MRTAALIFGVLAVLLGLVIAVAYVFPGPAQAQPSLGPWEHAVLGTGTGTRQDYSLEDKRFSVVFPKGWEVRRYGDGTVAALRPTDGRAGSFRGNVIVACSPLPAGQRLAGYFARCVADNAAETAAYRERGRGQHAVDGSMFEWVSYSCVRKGQTFKNVTYMTQCGADVWTIACIAGEADFESCEQAFRSCAESLRALEAAGVGRRGP